MDVMVTGRHCSVPEDFRQFVEGKVDKIAKFSDRIQRTEVQVAAYGDKRRPEESTRVEITVRGKGPVVRAEASAADKIAAFEKAMDRISAQLRKAQDRRKVHRGMHTPTALHEAAAKLPPEPEPEPEEAVPTRTVAGMEVTGDGPLVVREKTHPGRPMTVGEAIEQMELVGHDFYLFIDAATGQPSVSYRRKAYDFGVIHLDVAES